MIISFDKNLVYRIVEDNVFLLNCDGYFFVIDDPVGFFIFNALDSGAQSKNSVVEQLIKQFDVDKETALKDVTDYLNKLSDDKIIKIS